MSGTAENREISPFSLGGSENAAEIDVALLDFETHRRLLDHTWATMQKAYDTGDIEAYLNIGRQVSGVFFRYWQAKFQQFARVAGATDQTAYPDLLGKTVEIGDEKIIFSAPSSSQRGVKLERKVPNGEDSVDLTRVSTKSWDFEPSISISAAWGTPIYPRSNVYPLKYRVQINESGLNTISRERELWTPDRLTSLNDYRTLRASIRRPTPSQLSE